MPITLGCPSCGKRFRARDESVGRRVKCPFCQAAVQVRSPEESRHAAAPTDVVARPPSGTTPPPPPRVPPTPASGTVPPPRDRDALFDVAKVPTRPTPPPAPVPAATPADWGTTDAPSKPIILEDEPEPPSPFTMMPAEAKPGRSNPPPAADRKKDKGAKPAAPGRPAKPSAGPPEAAIAGWRRTRAGLFWALFGVFWFALIGFVPFGKLVYERAVGELPKGEGQIYIEGYVNSGGPDAVKLDRREELNLLLYGVPVLLGGMMVVLGRVACVAAPRASGAKGLFFFSGLFALIALAGLATLPVCEKINYREVAHYARTAALVCGALSEFWFLLALAAVGGTVRWPDAVRAVGGFALVAGLGYVIATVGWDTYLRYGPEIGRPRGPDPDWQFYETAAKMLGWLILVGSYWRAVRAVRIAVRGHVEDLEDGTAGPHPVSG